MNEILASPDRVAALLEKAIALAGSQEKLGKLTGYTQNAIYHALKTRRTTGEMANSIHKALGGRVHRADLRPDLFQRPKRQSVSA